ncbi:TatD family hydrolase [Halioxenophilus sp. WMMB6]|uniref:TatD family hydrolase n=1 Tax=Halioxenophilus sp. WMMB6 TaxID=3073815 RepID=UPI00295F0659|nr:TatD family hydrolase [Halioxenophilus sp. WMMB6]
MLVDSHCHLDRLDLTPYGGDLDKLIAAAQERGVDRILCIAISVENRAAVQQLADQYEMVYASTGVHPLDIDAGRVSIDDLCQWVQGHTKTVAIGETGLDYYYDDKNKLAQQESFVVHLQAAGITKTPVVVHTRNAKQDTLALIREHGDLESAGVLHCFTEDWDMAKKAIDMNYYISISGIVTFKNAGNVREVVKNIPLERLLIETDAPYLAPVPHRGKRNEPKYVREVAEYIAEYRGLSLAELAKITSDNFDHLFLKA